MTNTDRESEQSKRALNEAKKSHADKESNKKKNDCT